MSRRFARTLLATAICSSCIPVISLAADQLPTVVVTPTRSAQSLITVPSSIRIISAEDIRRANASSVSELLRGLGGMHVTDLYGDGTNASVSMRGFGATAGSNVLVIIDGRRLNNVDLSDPDLNSVSVNNIERIEIVQGSAGALYGDQAVGGVINIVTRDAQADSKSVEVATGSYSRRQLTANINTSISDATRLQIAAKMLRNDNYRDNNELKSNDLLARINHSASDGSVFLEMQQIDTRQELPGSLLEAEVQQDRRQSYVDFIDDYSDAMIQVVRGGFDLALSDRVSLEMEVSSRDEDRLIQNSFRGFQITTPSSIDNNQLQMTPRLVGSMPSPFGDVLMTMGVDRIRTNYNSQITFIDDEQSIDARYLQLVVPIYHQLTLTAGARKSQVTNDVQSTYLTGEVRDSARAQEVGLAWRPQQNLRLFMRVDENFRFAKVDEFTFTSPGDQLDNQKGRSKEVGVEWNASSFTFNVVAYQLKLRDEIAFDDSATPPVGSFFPGANVNFDPTTHEGLIFDGSYDVSDRLSLFASFSYVDARFDAGVLQDKHISGVPQRVASLAISHQLNDALQTYLEWNYTGDRYQSGDNQNALPKQPSHSVINANVQYQNQRWTYALKVNNLLDKKYIESQNSFGSFYPAPELNVWLSAKYSFE